MIRRILGMWERFLDWFMALPDAMKGFLILGTIAIAREISYRRDHK